MKNHSCRLFDEKIEASGHVLFYFIIVNLFFFFQLILLLHSPLCFNKLTFPLCSKIITSGKIIIPELYSDSSLKKNFKSPNTVIICVFEIYYLNNSLSSSLIHIERNISYFFQMSNSSLNTSETKLTHDIMER